MLTMRALEEGLDEKVKKKGHSDCKKLGLKLLTQDRKRNNVEQQHEMLSKPSPSEVV